MRWSWKGWHGMRTKTSWLGVLVVTGLGTAVVWGANHFGLWWATLAVGILTGITVRGAWRPLLASVSSGLLGWALALSWQSLHANIAGAASVVAGVMGFGSQRGILVFTLTLLLAILFSLGGVWLGTSLRRLYATFA